MNTGTMSIYQSELKLELYTNIIKNSSDLYTVINFSFLIWSDAKSFVMIIFNFQFLYQIVSSINYSLRVSRKQLKYIVSYSCYKIPLKLWQYMIFIIDLEMYFLQYSHYPFNWDKFCISINNREWVIIFILKT